MAIQNSTTRQKIIIVVFILVVIFLIWQVIGIYKGHHSMPNTIQTAKTAQAPQMIVPQPAQLPKKPAPLTEREIALIKLQQQTEEKYLNALNELQMLKVEKDIAETNKAIATAKFDTATAQKHTIDLLTKPAVPEGTYAQGLTNPTPVTHTIATPLIGTEVNYVVISVSQLHQRWNAVLGYQGKLFTVLVGDILPTDNSKVIAIDKSGVTLEKDNVKKKISLVPII